MTDYKLPTSLTLAMVTESVANDEDEGWCLSCGEIAYSIEPDARCYECEACGEKQVFGNEEILLMFEGAP